MIAITPTDIDWFNFLKDRLNFQQINFWTDTPWNPRKLNKGDKFYFLLKAPIRKISGYASFSYYQNLSIKEAWQKFGRGNGVNSLYELGVKVTGDRKPDFSTEIGCIILENPVFLDQSNYFHPQKYNLSFPNEISKHKYYPNLDQINFASDYKQVGLSFSSISDEDDYQFNQSSLTKGQSEFRNNIFKYYDQCGVVTRETCVSVLDAVHIHPYINEHKHHLKNGILLRSDLHKLFDDGLITITPDYKVLISQQLKSKYYYQYQEERINLPANERFYPDQKILEFHNQYIFREQI